MTEKCPSCHRPIEVEGPPQKGVEPWQEWWLCMYEGCEKVVCAWCYCEHTSEHIKESGQAPSQ